MAVAFLSTCNLLDSSLSKYISQISSIPMLSAERERYLALRLSAGADLEAAKELVVSHLRLVVKIAFKFKRYGLPMSDVISEGNIGLMNAVKKFRVDMNCRLSTYAVWWIKASIQSYILKTWSLVKVGTAELKKRLFYGLRHSQSGLGRYDGGVGAGCAEQNVGTLGAFGGVGVLMCEGEDVSAECHAVDASDVECAAAECSGNDAAGYGLCEVENSDHSVDGADGVSCEFGKHVIHSEYGGGAGSTADGMDCMARVISLDENRGGDGNAESLMDSVQDMNCIDPENSAIEQQSDNVKVAALSKALGVLSEREKDIVVSRHLAEERSTLDSLSRRYGISKERVRQIENKAMQRLRDVLTEDALCCSLYRH